MHCSNLERTLVKEKTAVYSRFWGSQQKFLKEYLPVISVYLSNFTYRFYADAKFIGA